MRGFTPHLFFILSFMNKLKLQQNNLNHRKGAGFTLIEVLIIVIIFSLVVGIIYGSYILSQKAYLEGETSAELTQNGRVITERITREIRQAREIVTELSEEEAGAASTIVFEDGHIDESYHYIRYWLDNSQVKREIAGYYFSDDIGETLVAWDSIPPLEQTLETKILENPVVIGEYVNDLKFWGSETIHLSLVLSKRDKTINLATDIFGRNF